MDLPNIKDAPIMAIDLETYDPELLDNGPGWGRNKGYVVGIAVAVPGQSWYFPIRHQGDPGNLDSEKVLNWAKEAFSGSGDKVFANANYDLGWLKWEGVDVNGFICDVQLAEPLIDEYARSYSLNSLAAKYLGESKVEDELYTYLQAKFGGPKGRRQAGNIWRAPIELVEPYARGDVELPLRIWELQKKELIRQDLWQVYEVEAKLCPILVDMRLRGVRVDVEKAEMIDQDWTMQLEVYGQEFPLEDVNKAAALARYCDQRGIKYPTTDKGNPSFEGMWLKNNLPIVYEIRRLLKARDTFVRGYILDKHVNGRLHGTFNQLRSDEYGTVSGRLSSSNPNLQNIPARDEEIGPLVRSLFLPDEGEIMSAQDWSQIEFRLFVHYSGSEDLISAYHQGTTDFHQVVTDMFGGLIPRKIIKGFNFMLLYGGGKKRLAEMLREQLTEAEAYDLRDKIVRGVQ